MALLLADRDFAAADAALQRGVALDPSLPTPHRYRSFGFASVGRFVEAEREARRAVELAPASLEARGDLLQLLLTARRYRHAAAEASAVLSRHHVHRPGHLGRAGHRQCQADPRRALVGHHHAGRAGRPRPLPGRTRLAALGRDGPPRARAAGAGLRAGVALVAGGRRGERRGAGRAWTVFGSLVHTAPNLLPNTRGLPLWTALPMLLVGIVAAPLTEELAFRGYAMGLLRRHFGPLGVLLISSALFAAAHLTHGLYPTKLIVYFLFGLGLAVIVWRTGSLAPAMAVHAFGDLVFFVAVWPHDAGRRLAAEGGADAGFFAAVALTVVFGVLWALALRRLLEATEARPAADHASGDGVLATI
jgi:membrane protease YdiL (CAAX protease family)